MINNDTIITMSLKNSREENILVEDKLKKICKQQLQPPTTKKNKNVFTHQQVLNSDFAGVNQQLPINMGDIIS